MRGSSAVYTLTVGPANGMRLATTAVTWTIDNPGVATLSQEGRLTAHAAGTVTITAVHEGNSASFAVQVPFNNDNPSGANLEITFSPDPVHGSPSPCGGAFWGSQTPTWSMDESIKETRGVGFTLTELTYRYLNERGELILELHFPENHRFPPYDEHVEDGCVALNGSPSGSFEQILLGIDENGNQLTFAGKVQLLPVAK